MVARNQNNTVEFDSGNVGRLLALNENPNSDRRPFDEF